jgi:two-component system response regulator HydG
VARILIVDEEKHARLTLQLALRREGHAVEAVGRADEFLEAIRGGRFDLVLADVPRAGSGGLALLRTLRREAPAIDVVVMTSAGTIEGAVEAMRLGARSYLPKPVDPVALRSACAALEPVRDLPNGPSAPDLREIASFDAILGTSRVMRDLLELVRNVGETESTVLITGETGTGKELIGQALHRASRRRERVFCALNSAAFPETLLESELFGHRRGAFTGASQHKRGLLESAHDGTVFLDEVAEMPLSMQAKLLRFLQTGEIRPVGGETTRLVDVRLITATNKELEREVRAGRFREDLFYRLAVITIHVPPLRERAADVPLLALHFLRRFAAKLGRRLDGIEADALEALARYAWPGNVRELENTIERGAALCRATRLSVADLPERLRVATRPEPERESLQSLELLERRHILATLERVAWNRKRAAEILQISTTTLWRRLKVFGIEPAPAGSATLHADPGPRGL